MPKYLVERHLPGFDTAQLPGAASMAKKAAAEMTSEGTPVSYLRSTFLPGDDKCYCLFEAPSEAAVREVNQRAELPLLTVTEALHIASEDL